MRQKNTVAPMAPQLRPPSREINGVAQATRANGTELNRQSVKRREGELLGCALKAELKYIIKIIRLIAPGHSDSKFWSSDTASRLHGDMAIRRYGETARHVMFFRVRPDTRVNRRHETRRYGPRRPRRYPPIAGWGKNTPKNQKNPQKPQKGVRL